MKQKMLLILLAAFICTASCAVAEVRSERVGAYGGSGTDLAMDGLVLSDGFLLVGSSSSVDGDVPYREGAFDNYHDAWAVRTDVHGNVLWDILFDEGENIYEQFTGVTQLPDGRFALLYTHMGMNQETMEPILVGRAVLVDDTGAVLGDIPLPEKAFQLYPLSDGIMATWFEDEWNLESPARSRQTTLARVDWEGNVLWQRTYDELLPMSVNDIVEDANGYWLIGDWREGQPYSGAVVRLDAQGEIQAKTVLPAKAYGTLRTGIPDGEGGLIAAGTQSAIMEGEPFYFYGHAVRFAADGSVLWNLEQSETGHAVEYGSMLPLGDDILLLGRTEVEGMHEAGYDTGDNTGWLWRMDRDGNTLLEEPAGMGYGFLLLLPGPDGSLYILDDGHAGSDFCLTRITLP